MSDQGSLVTTVGQGTTSSVNTASAYVGITKSALDLLNSTHPVNQLVYNIIKWLGRECIDQSDFQYALEQSHGLAYPNEFGLQIREHILRNESKVARAGGLHLIKSGAVGRWMAFSQDHAYMVTTVATITKCQGMAFAADVLCEMVMAHMDGSLDEEKYHFSYSVDRIRLRGVLSRIAESIVLNVVNPGHTLGDLPDELQDLCVHFLDAGTYARAVLKVARSSSNVLLLSDRFQGDMLLWVLAHFEGSIDVSLAGKQIYNRLALHGKRKFVMVIKEVCEQGCRKTCHSMHISEFVKGEWTRIMEAHDDCTLKTTPACRIPLYEKVPDSGDRNRDILNREENLKVKNLARRLLLWMMDAPIKVSPHSTTLFFEADFSELPSENLLRVGDLLYRWPSFLQTPKDGGPASSSLAFQPTRQSNVDGSEILYKPTLEPLSVLCESFPALADLLAELQERCNCRICRNNGSVDDCKHGCLRNAAADYLFLLVGNAIADGFGAQDASGVGGVEEYAYEVRKVVTELAIDRMVWWDHWFNVAASTVLGYIPKGILGTAHLDDGAGPLCAVQYGSNVVAAKWLDLTSKMSARQSFAFEMEEGHVQGTSTNLVLVHTEAKMELRCNLDNSVKRNSTHSFAQWQDALTEAEADPLIIEHAIISSSDPIVVRLLTIVSTASSRRIINPADALSGAFRSVFFDPATLDCQHLQDPTMDESVANDIADNSYLWTFEALVANWEIENQGVFWTRILDSDAKLNITLSLSPLGCMIKPKSACVLCVAKSVAVQIGQYHRRVVSFSPNAQALVRR